MTSQAGKDCGIIEPRRATPPETTARSVSHDKKRGYVRPPGGTQVHYNCAQSVLLAFEDRIGLTEEQAFQVASHFGAGMRHGSTCGVLSGGLMVLGMTHYPPEEVDSFRRKFLEDHGEINCAALLKKSHDAGIPRKEHCDGLVFDVVQMLE